MSSQLGLYNRRQFLERSAWGFGSLLVSSSLLQSCINDHNIPQIIPPGLGDDVDWNNDAKLAVATALGYIPEVGVFVSALVTIIWPFSGSSPWDGVKAQVEALVDQKLADDDYNRVTANLAGLRGVIGDYKQAITNNADIKTYWIIAFTDCDLYQPSFQQKGDEVLLLPLFAQFANLYMGLLRDVVLFGKSWGMTDTEIQTYTQKFDDKFTEFTNYAYTTYSNGRAPKLNIPRDDKAMEPFRSTNTYDRFMTMLVLDYMDAWGYFNPRLYPNGAVNPDGTKIRIFTREIYSDPYGNRVNFDRKTPPFALPSEPAYDFPTQITVWAGHRIDAVQLTYPAGDGPNNVTTTPRMGDSNGGSPYTFDTGSAIPITKVVVSYDWTAGMTATQVIDSLQFTFNNGYQTGTMGTTQGQFTPSAGYNGYGLSSIYIDGVDETLSYAANCIVFGFLPWPK
ncbi:insecticidal delta-endotoxin Cry8Ea1 family protein [Larkinella sp.]|uniref:insecticidal delta-endotoxin Cry8Ea1 family protein n=1 Tax=Larkinella sp. TaxID=2034517 RepID=UPI003BACC441